MAFQASVYRILIASPSDVEVERDIATRVIQEWNDVNSADREVALLPVRWETHTWPEFGRPPQEAINKQIVDDCDLLIGVFWTRIGTRTQAADSGTLEEIERIAGQGKPVMLYFSRTKQNPDEIDVEQLQSLRAFRQKVKDSALIEQFSDPVEFRDKLARGLERQVRALMVAGDNPSLSTSEDKPAADTQIQFANLVGEPAGTGLIFKARNFRLSRLEEVPDLAAPLINPNLSASGRTKSIIGNI